MKRNTWQGCSKGRDVIKVCSHDPRVEVRSGKGDHVFIADKASGQAIAVCDREMGKGLAAKVAKFLTSIGIFVGVLVGGFMIAGMIAYLWSNCPEPLFQLYTMLGGI